MDDRHDDEPKRMDRREVLAWMASAAAAIPALDARLLARPGPAPGPAEGYGVDPDLTRHYRPGDLWPLTLDKGQRRALGALSDTILPADDRSPAATEVGVVDFLDEWLSAPYPAQRRDRDLILKGLTWLDRESRSRFGASFQELEDTQRTAICDDICDPKAARARFREAARFFARVRDLAAGAFYSTPKGRADVGYVGNAARGSFEGPPPEVLERLGL